MFAGSIEAVFTRSLLSVASVALLLAFGLGGCRSNGGAASDARIHVDAGKLEITLGEKTGVLPADDVSKDVPTVTRDEAGRRLAYRTSSGKSRTVYLVGDGLFPGPLVASPVDFRVVPELEQVLGTLFELAGDRRADLVREVRRERGDSGVVRLLVDGAHVDDPAWEEGMKQLSPESAGALREGLAIGLEPGKPAALLRRAVRVVDLRAPARAGIVAQRARELASGTLEPRAAAVLLRAVLANDEQKAAEIGCEVLVKAPAGGEEDGRDSLVEAATLAIAAAGATCPDPKGLEAVLADGCKPWFRCSQAGPVSWSDTSKQDEPLCTKEQLAKAIEADLARPPKDVLESGARPGLFAYAALAAKDRVPASFTHAHARRRYALAQSAEPVCDTDLAPGTPCHCDEATVRLYACREPTSTSVHVGVCRFDVGDKQKKISNVVATPPP